MTASREQVAHHLYTFTQAADLRKDEFPGPVRVQPDRSPRTRPSLELFYEQRIGVLTPEEIDRLGEILEKMWPMGDR
jgi:hypothetical protein